MERKAMTYHPGKFVWFELETTDIAAAQAFFGEVFGWKTRAQQAGQTAYEMIEVAGQVIGGYRKLRTRSDPHWASFISVPDLDEAIARAKGAGSRHIGEVLDTPGLGSIVEIIDTVGAKVHLVTRTGGDEPERTPPPGAFMWTELVTRLPDRAVDFYRTVFGYEVKPMEMATGGTYYVLETRATGRAGVLHKDASPQWLPYVSVNDCDRALERAVRMGAREMMPPTDIPKIGRYAVFADPQGADLAIMTPAPM
jgi:predicted enzyme related to lactoylglutathione lyase